jgi:hypothetical protein
MPSRDFISADDVRPSDLSAFGWFGVVIAGAGVGHAVYGVVDWFLWAGDPFGNLLLGGFALLFGAVVAHDNAKPECKTACDNCGTELYVHSGRDNVSEYVAAYASGPPRRATLGPLSLIIGRQEITREYCSGECAAEDSRVVIHGHDHTVASATPEEEHVAE